MGEKKITLALAGNPNVGKSTVFNTLTGLNQHTGNWTGKTVANAVGTCRYDGTDFTLVDLPGTYSLLSNSAEEELARDFIAYGGADSIVVVADATALERNLNLLFQILEITRDVILCVNLLDEAARKKITVDCEKLSAILHIPVVGISAVKNQEVYQILDAAASLRCKPTDQAEQPETFRIDYDGVVEEAVALIIPRIRHILQQENVNLDSRFVALKLLSDEKTTTENIEKYTKIDITSDIELPKTLLRAKKLLSEAGFDSALLIKNIVSSIVKKAEEIAKETVTFLNPDYTARDRKIDKILTSKKFGFPIMLFLLGILFFITIQLANYPSDLLALLFGWLEKQLNLALILLKTPGWFQAPLMDGIYKTTAWVVSVMLPPMAIFFPLFTLLEDLGYLPRVAFNLDNSFKKCGCSGKQSLCMCMGFGCNAAGVIGARIIDSPRERNIAIVTNSFVPCNGRFPTLIAVSAIFIGGSIANRFLSGLISALCVTLLIVLSILTTLLMSKILSRTLLKGTPSAFSLELPPYRKPQVGKILYRSLLDRTAVVLWRAVKVSIPAGLLIWLLANITAGGNPLIYYLNGFFKPLAWLMGLDGSVLTAFVLGFPANEIVIPITLMSYSGAGSLTDFTSIGELGNILKEAGWTLTTGISMLIFTLFHFPCATTCFTIKKETKSLRWTLVSFLLPTIVGIAACSLFTGAVRLMTMI